MFAIPLSINFSQPFEINFVLILHSSFETKKSGDQFPWKVTTYFRHYKPKLILPLKSVLLYNIPFTLKIAFEIMKLFKMHQIIKPTCPSRQLFIKITFAFIKIFDFLVKIAIFGAFLFRSRDSRHALLPETIARSRLFWLENQKLSWKQKWFLWKVVNKGKLVLWFNAY